MSAPKFEHDTAEMDRLLNGVGEALELTPEQRLRARAEYNALGQWLSQPGTTLGRSEPDVYPQGSTRIGTEVRPLSTADGDACEHDLDAVAEFRRGRPSAMAQYEALFQRLSENPRYRPHLERKNRCVRIDFPGEFHLDVLPALPDDARPETTCIKIPDRERRDWTTSNPKGFAKWFEDQGAQARRQFEHRRRMSMLQKALAPLPELPTFREKPVLNRVVQLIKRRRDVVFMGAETAPRSIILTTLAAEYYDGEVALLPALINVVAKMRAAIDEAWPRRIKVLNPTNPRENFADAWRNDDVAYQRFVDFVRGLESDLVALSQTTGLERVVRLLESLFGSAPVRKSYNVFREELRKAADTGHLRIQKGRGLVAGASTGGVVVPESTHFGAEFFDTIRKR